ncbi:SulP family inorganic anion transporter [Baekduia sp. Peel2402]|uniref:SulP family inorganic anion transporter n=1 Tax=Baekduia sp. Peel2402 TaxID=3458296 RepID=UPI00403E8F56
MAGLTVAALALPSGMAYAQLAGLPAVIGLYALLLPSVAYALLGSSRPLIVGPEGSLAALVAASVLPLAAPGSADAAELAAMLSLLVGACFVAAWLLRLGWIADYLSRPVLVGYIHGVAVVLVIGQLGKLMGLDIAAIDPLPQLAEVVREADGADATTVAVAVGGIVVLAAGRIWVPKVPMALVVVVVGIVLADAADLAAHGVALVGHVPSGLPSPTLPTPGASDTIALIPSALGLFLLCFADEVLTARAYAGRHAQHVDANRELLAMGAASAAAGITRGMPVGGSGSRTAVNDAMGARTQVSSLVAAGAVLLVLLFLTGPIADLPKALLGAAIVVAAAGLIEPRTWRALWTTDRAELAIAAFTAGGVIGAGVLQAIALAVGLSILDVVRRSARPHDAVLGWVPRLGRYADVALHRSAEVTDGVVVYRLDDRLFFANAGYVKGRVREALRGAPTPPRRLVLDAEGMSHVDAAGLDALSGLIAELEEEGVEVCVARAKAPLSARLDVTPITADRRFATVRAAVSASRGSSPSPAPTPHP